MTAALIVVFVALVALIAYCEHVDRREGDVCRDCQGRH